MLAAGGVGLLCGAALGLRFKVFALALVLALTAAAATTAILCGRVTVFEAVFGFIGWSLGLQVSYLAVVGLAPMGTRRPG